MIEIDSISEIAAEFDAMLIDQFGVMHDGKKLYPGTLAALKVLYEHRVPVVALTNSGKRSADNMARLLKLGIPRDYVHNLLSSGELAYAQVKGKKVFAIGKDGENYGFEGVDFVSSMSQADIVVVLGSNAPQTSLDEYRTLLKSCSLPMLCCNPDKLMITSHGLLPAPGAIADVYAEMGGEIKWIGKPYPEIYQAALKLLGNPRRVLCVGDSTEHDVAGGKGAGLSTLLILGGVSEGLKMSDIRVKPEYVMRALK